MNIKHLNNRKKSNLFLFLFTITILLASNFIKAQQYADLVLYNGKIITVDKNNTITEAIAISADTIMSVGSNESIKSYINDSTKKINLKGQTVLPGFIDSHAHLIGTGKAKVILNLQKAKNWDEVVSLVKNAVSNTKRGEWIIGRGWHQEKWNPKPVNNVKGYPYHYKLSKVSPNNPVLLSHASGHAIFANEKAMQIAKISPNTPNPHGGEIVKDKDGNPIGVFMEEAETLIYAKHKEHQLNKPTKELKREKQKYINIAIKECLSKGITTLHDAGETFEDLNIIKEMADSNQIKIRLYEMILENYNSLKDSLKTIRTIGANNKHLTIRAIKLYMDGALGSRGAWLLKPYSDLPEQSGLNVTALSEIEKITKLAVENNFQICTHAIGDKANRTILDIYENTLKNNPNRTNLRWRVEHAQHLSPDDIPRFNKLGIIAAMQGIHCTSDASFVEKRLGEKRAKEGAYIWRSLMENGTTICNGTDSPVEDIDPIPNIYASVTRRRKDGNEFYPNQKMTRLKAIKSYTINGAYAAFEENIKGSLEVGKLADITVLSKNILTIPSDEILNTKVMMTIVGGKILFRRNN